MENWQKRLQSHIVRVSNENVVAVEDGYSNISVPTLVTGNGTTTLLTCPVGRCIVIRAVLISGEGNVGTAKVGIGGTVILPLYFSNAARNITGPSLRLRLTAGESVSVVTADRGGSETFVGVTYYEVEV